MSYKIKELPVDERPRERLKKVGVCNLTDSEVLSILLKTGTKDRNVNEVSMDLLKRYELIKKQGKGGYGVVYKAMDKKTKEIVALKKNFDAFQNATDSQRTYREIT